MNFYFNIDNNFSMDTLATVMRRAIDYGCVQRYLLVLAIDSLKYTDLAYLHSYFWVPPLIFGIYMLLKDAFPKKSVTKYILRLDILDINGNDAKLWQRIVRNIPLAIPMMETVEGIFLVCNSILNDSPRRMGDILAGTYVVSTGRRHEFKYMSNIKNKKSANH